MYGGCRNYFIKKKYADENHCVNDICIPLKINERYHRTISKIKRQKEWARVFWAKCSRFYFSVVLSLADFVSRNKNLQVADL